MATTYISNQISAGKQPRVLPPGAIISQLNTFLNSVAFVINDLVNFVQLEAMPTVVGNGPTILDVQMDVPALDSSTGVSWTVGDSVTAARYISTQTLGRSGAGGVAQMNVQGALGFQPFLSAFGSFGTAPAISNQVYTIVFKITAAATGTATTGNTLTMEVDYTYDP